MAYIASNGTLSAKPYSPSTGVPTDGRSMFYDETNFVWRPYQNTTEVLSYLNTPASRKGLFPIIINTGGTLSNGVITGGTNTLFYFKDGVADVNLVPFGGVLELWTDEVSPGPNTGTMQGAGTEGDPIAVNTTVIATRAYADSVAGAGVTDGDKGDISITSGVWTIDNGVVTLAKQASLATKTYIGRTTAGTGVPEAVPIATLKADLALVKGDVGLGNVDNTSDATKNSTTATLTNKRINPRVQTVASSATVTPNADTDDLVTITAQAVGLTIANPSGTPVAGQAIVIRIKDNSTPQTIAFGTEYRAIGITLPTTTVASKTMYIGAIRNATDTKWDVLSVVTEA